MRHRLHRAAEVANTESRTKYRIIRRLKSIHPDNLLSDLGGTGVAAVFNGKKEGPTVLLRAELDALPINEDIELEYCSTTEGVSHKCGHDGHMAMLFGAAELLSKNRPKRGRIVVLYQPAEETGEGASRVINDPNFNQIQPDYVFALHNLPGFEKHHIIVKDNVFASASKGLIVKLQGATAHAAQPENARTPALAMAQIIQGLSAAPQLYVPLEESAKVTVIHAKLGEIAFGTTPGNAIVMATFRTHSKAAMDTLSERSLRMIAGIASSADLDVSSEWVEEFPATINDAGCNTHVRLAALENKLDLQDRQHAFPWSEDFGHFTQIAPGALFGLGSGVHQPALHHPTYDFPDEILPTGVKMFVSIVNRILNHA
ncbi:amidohydrolase [bacterium]|nr:amidohydrolase [bacterium]